MARSAVEVFEYAYRVGFLGLPPLKSRQEAKICRKSTLRRLAALAEQPADLSLLKRNCRECGSCWVAKT